MLGSSLILLSLAALAAAKQVSGIFTSIDDVHKEGSTYGTGFNSYSASVAWKIPASAVSPGDTFQLTLDCVMYAVDFNLVSGSTVLAKCASKEGTNVSNRIVTCIATDAVDPDMSYSGEITFPFTLDTGLSGDSSELNCAKTYDTPGKKTLTFSDGSNKITSPIYLQEGLQYSDDPNKISRNRFLVAYPTYRDYLLAGNCPEGYISGTLGIETDVDTFDCDTLEAKVTDQLNEFAFPETASPNPEFSISCTKKKVTVTYWVIPAGERPFLDIESIRSEDHKRTYTYTNKYHCIGLNSETYNGLIAHYYGKPIDDPDSSGQGSAVPSLSAAFSSSVRPSSSTAASSPAGPSSSAAASSPAGPSSSAAASSPVNSPVSSLAGPSSSAAASSPVNSPVSSPAGPSSSAAASSPVNSPVNSPVSSPVSSPAGPSSSAAASSPVNSPVSSPAGPSSSAAGSSGHITTVTSTASISVPTTFTITPTTSGGTTSVVIEVPPTSGHITTVTSTASVSVPTTFTITPTTSGGTTSVVIEVPPTSGHITTVTSTASVSVPTTFTITPTTSGGTTSVVIEVPPNGVIRPPIEPIGTTTLTGTIRTTVTECPICTCYNSVVTTTGANGAPTSETVGIIVTTNPVGSIYTSISRQHTATVTGVITAYVTTCVATLPGGAVATSTASVVVATNSHGSIFTRSEIIGYPSNIPGQISSYITTYVSSIGNSVVTTSHEVIVATNSVGSTYITSMPNGPVEPTLGVAVPGNQGQPQPPSGSDVATTDSEGGKPPSGPGVQDTTTLTGAPSVETESQTIAGVSTGAAGFDSTSASSSIPFANAANTIKTQSVFAVALLSMFVNFF